MDLHYVAQRILQASRHRTDIAEMLDEYDPLDLDKERLEDVTRVIGRDYDELDWYALEVDTSAVAEEGDDKTPPEMAWLAAEPMPFFTATFRGRTYTSSEMGLGEFGVHLLFWYLYQWSEVDEIKYLLLDEPDAYLPPVAAQALIRRLLWSCLQHGWSLVVTTHSQPVIAESAEERAFVRLDVDSSGAITSTHVRDAPGAADDLLAAPPLRRVLFVEDESAYYLTRSLLRATDRRADQSTMVVWKDGYGYMKALREALPRTPDSRFAFAFVFDGDKRVELGPSGDRQWPTLYLPTEGDPDALFVSLGREVARLADRLRVDAQELQWTIDSLAGADPHDWVNALAAKHDRGLVLRALADLWIELNPDEATEFCRQLRDLL
ncbi:ATP-binding protein [Microbacterium azadirachtae]|uniref:ATP-binding protein n=1 Tax=Microbacterium azadirachtae TaxID=582680 RepID=UPI0021D4CB83|nr:ATP-binding protein [Microbacterium azadirachtae]UXW87080.1 ATP-binding protein [Microbacterium azadirachtae]